ncbi:MAG: Na+/H+ antiporter subunit E [Anaerolineales bacterium]|nr:Na+/H+ antiporter subunit E [Anaerolineales bacterium]
MNNSASMFKETLIRIALFSFLWGILIGLDWEGWLFGFPVIIIAAYISLVLVPQQVPIFRPINLIRFSIYFFWHAFRGGSDVIVRAFHPQLPIEPGFLHYGFRLPQGSARVFLTFITSLLPGTLSSIMKEDQLILHVLDLSQPVSQQILNLENQVADLFRLKLQ